MSSDAPTSETISENKADVHAPSPAAKAKKTKIWVGGLPPRSNKDKLKEEFLRAYEINDPEMVAQVSVMIKLGYGFISVPKS